MLRKKGKATQQTKQHNPRQLENSCLGWDSTLASTVRFPGVILATEAARLAGLESHTQYKATKASHTR